ncbi:FAD/NAD(P)-binding protein [Mucilaginibacter jinjuensis]|uniref:FAD/NAD(P)-binding protein n=1 Tax=Mucilaginibacter jinjuensis TaxID=1176721 RepID=A0ABY7TAI6_9SPHI|nr:FAD/NAD(P)-binding protein [Mucilaginibacter jinjuensis]WCT12966.1 FAD/NAD(P)-binding protein [Mucilaginibacter jinjuensis]
MRTIAIVGGGFAGTMTAVHLMQQADFPLNIILINNRFPLIKGIAYATPYTEHLLNVPVSSISAFSQHTDHFFNWLQQHNDFKDVPAETLKNSFAPRKVYAEYLNTVWTTTLENKSERVIFQLVEDEVINVISNNKGFDIELKNAASIKADYVVLATGNAIPKNIPIADNSFYDSKLYFKNPWDDTCMQDLKSERDILIIGNSLTMIDAVISLQSKGFSKKIYTMSPHGFAIMPDATVPPYDVDILSEISRPYRLYDLVKVINKHIKRCEREGISKVAVVNSIRYQLQNIWFDFTLEDKRYFLKRVSSIWNAWRHRTPAGMYERISKLINSGKLTPITGRLLSLIEKDGYVEATIKDKKASKEITLDVERVINCTGSQIDVNLPGSLLNTLYIKGLIDADPLKISLNADAVTNRVIDRSGNISPNMYTLGNNMKGILWETTGVPEIRAQAENVAVKLLAQIKETNPLSSPHYS